jgi:hypothetical protein
VPVLLDTRHQNQIRDAEAVRVGYRRGDSTLDDGELVRCLLVGVAALLEFDYGDQAQWRLPARRSLSAAGDFGDELHCPGVDGFVDLLRLRHYNAVSGVQAC